jgi:RNA polymerase sigma-70 factor (ECF subfamily)
MTDSATELTELIRRARDGDRDALNQLCEKYRPFLRLIAKSGVGAEVNRRAETSDVVQLTELDIAQSIQDFRGTTEPEFSAWLKRILHRNIADAVRNNRAAKRDVRREARLDDPHGSAAISWFQPIGNDATPSQFVMKGESALQLALALESLAPDQRDVVRLRHIEGLKLHEIATQLHKTPGAVAGLLRRGLVTLRDRMGSESRYI